MADDRSALHQAAAWFREEEQTHLSKIDPRHPPYSDFPYNRWINRNSEAKAKAELYRKRAEFCERAIGEGRDG